MRTRIPMILCEIAVFLLVGMYSFSAYACSVCFGGMTDDPANIALKKAILCLFGVLFIVLALFARFFWGIRQRSMLSSR